MIICSQAGKQQHICLWADNFCYKKAHDSRRENLFCHVLFIYQIYFTFIAFFGHISWQQKHRIHFL